MIGLGSPKGRRTRTIRLKLRSAITGITKPATHQVLRHADTTHLLQAGYDIGTAQELLGHPDVATTMIYKHVMKLGGGAVRSPIDAMNLT